MNEEHLRLCASAEWAQLVADDLLPWVLGEDFPIGEDVLEVGAGPGLVTELDDVERRANGFRTPAASGRTSPG